MNAKKSRLPLGTILPLEPLTLVAADFESNKVVVLWQNGTDAATAVIIDQVYPDGTSSTLKTLSGDAVGFTYPVSSSRTTISFTITRIRVAGNQGYSSPTLEVTVNRAAPPLPAPEPTLVTASATTAVTTTTSGTTTTTTTSTANKNTGLPLGTILPLEPMVLVSARFVKTKAVVTWTNGTDEATSIRVLQVNPDGSAFNLKTLSPTATTFSTTVSKTRQFVEYRITRIRVANGQGWSSPDLEVKISR